MIAVKSCQVIIIVVLTTLRPSHHFEGRNSYFLVPASDTCVCPGDQLTYECSSFGGVATVWHGSAFSNCNGQDNNELILRHSRFNVLGTTSSATAALDCNGQTLVASSIGVINDTFTSQLTVNATIDTSNKTIQCDREEANGTRILVGMSIPMSADPPLLWDNAHLAEVKRGFFVFKWSTTGNGSIECPTAIDYAIVSTNCGICPNFTGITKVSCKIIIDSRSQLCIFTVYTRVCGKLYGNPTVEHIMLTSRVPNPPKLKFSPLYEERSGNLAAINVTLMLNVSQAFNISEGIDGSPTSYTITYSDSITGTVCLRTIIPSTCGKYVCSHIFKASLSNCLATADIEVSVFATNIIGDGPASDPIRVDSDMMIPSNENENGLVIYLVSVTTALALVLICGIFIIFIAVFVCWIQHKRRSSNKNKHCKEERHEEAVVTYDEIDEFRQISSNINTSKNLAYCHITGPSQ